MTALPFQSATSPAPSPTSCSVRHITPSIPSLARHRRWTMPSAIRSVHHTRPGPLCAKLDFSCRMLHLFNLSILSFCVLAFSLFSLGSVVLFFSSPSFVEGSNAKPSFVFWPGCALLEYNLLHASVFVRISRVPPLRFFYLPFFSVDSSPLLPSSDPGSSSSLLYCIVHELPSLNLFAESREGLWCRECSESREGIWTGLICRRPLEFRGCLGLGICEGLRGQGFVLAAIERRCILVKGFEGIRVGKR